MEDTINSYFDNTGLNESNSLLHILDFDDDHNDLLDSMHTSYYYTDEQSVA